MHHREVDDEHSRTFSRNVNSASATFCAVTPSLPLPPSVAPRRYLSLPSKPSYEPFPVNPLYSRIVTTRGGEEGGGNGSSYASQRIAEEDTTIRIHKRDIAKEGEDGGDFISSLSLIRLQSAPPIRLFRAFYGIGFDGSRIPVEDFPLETENEKKSSNLRKCSGTEEHSCMPDEQKIITEAAEVEKREKRPHQVERNTSRCVPRIMMGKPSTYRLIEAAILAANEGLGGGKWNISSTWNNSSSSSTKVNNGYENEGEAIKDIQRNETKEKEVPFVFRAYRERGVVLRWNTCITTASTPSPAALNHSTFTKKECGTHHLISHGNQNSGNYSIQVGRRASIELEFTALSFSSADSPISALACSTSTGGGEDRVGEHTWAITQNGEVHYHYVAKSLLVTGITHSPLLSSVFPSPPPVHSSISTNLTLFSSSILLPVASSSTGREHHHTSSDFIRFSAVERPVQCIAAAGETVLALSSSLTSSPPSSTSLTLSSPSSIGEHGKDRNKPPTNLCVVYCWGDNRYGQCMRDPSAAPFFSTPVKFRTSRIGVQFLTCGGSHGTLVFDDGVLGVWGAAPSFNIPPSRSSSAEKVKNGETEENDSPELNRFPSVVPQLQPLRLPERVVRVSAGPAHVAAVTEKGEVWTWGVGRHGRLGHGGEKDEKRPRRIEERQWKDKEIMISISCGHEHTASLTKEGRVWLWGSNVFGQLGVFPGSCSTTSQNSSPAVWEGHPTELVTGHVGSTPVIKVVCGPTYTLMVLANGELVGCGVLKIVLDAAESVKKEEEWKVRIRNGPPLPPRCLLPDYITLSVVCGSTHAAACAVRRQLSSFVIWGGGKRSWMGERKRGSLHPHPTSVPVKDSGVKREDTLPVSSCVFDNMSSFPSWRQAAGGNGFFVFLSRDGRQIFQLTLPQEAQEKNSSLSFDNPTSHYEKEQEGQGKSIVLAQSEKISRPSFTGNGHSAKRRCPPSFSSDTCSFQSSVLESENHRRSEIRRPVMHKIPFPTCMKNRASEEIKESGKEGEKESGGVVVDHISCGPDYSIAVTTSGKAFGWGTNQYGQLRAIESDVSPSCSHVSSPVWLTPMYEKILSPAVGIAQVACGGTFVVVLMENGLVYEHGLACTEEAGFMLGIGEEGAVKKQTEKRKNEGEIGVDWGVRAHGDRVCTGPRRVLGFCHVCTTCPGVEEIEEDAVVMVAAGQGHALALSCRGDVFGWGRGVLGHDSPPSAVSPYPRKILFPSMALDCGSPFFLRGSGERLIRSIACGPFNSLALFDNGDLFVWGFNQFGQCGATEEPEAQEREFKSTMKGNLMRLDGMIISTPVKAASEVKSACFSSYTLVVIFERDGSVAMSGRAMMKAFPEKKKEKDGIWYTMTPSCFYTLTRISPPSYGLLHPLLSLLNPSPIEVCEPSCSSLVGIVCCGGYEGVMILTEENRPNEDDVSKAVIRLHHHT